MMRLLFPLPKRWKLLIGLLPAVVAGSVETWAQVSLSSRKLPGLPVQILVPVGFTPLPADVVRVKYPAANRPDLVYSDPKASVNLAFRHTPNRLKAGELSAAKEAILQGLRRTYPSATVYRSGVQSVQGRPVGFVEMLTPAVDTRVYNLLFFTEVNGRLLMCTFNCTQRQMTTWKASAEKIMHSLKIDV